MKSTLFGLGLLGLAVAAPANALTYVQDVNVNNRFGGYFNPFDTTLGTLTKVTVAATVSDLHGAQVQLFDPNFAGQVRMLVSGAIGSTLTDLISYAGDSGLVNVSGAQSLLTATGTGTGYSEYTGDALSRFFGTGPVFVGVDEAQLASVSYETPSYFPAYLREINYGSGINIAHHITYEYEAPGGGPGNVGTPVPEPASWAMMIIGFGVVGGALRRSRLRRPAVAALD